MKPKSQIDFIVEEFYNTGKFDLNSTLTEKYIAGDSNRSLGANLPDEDTTKLNKAVKASLQDLPIIPSEFVPTGSFWIKLLQNTLDLPISGKYDEATEEAVRQFQDEKKIDVDGIVGINTWEELFRKDRSLARHPEIEEILSKTYGGYSPSTPVNLKQRWYDESEKSSHSKEGLKHIIKNSIRKVVSDNKEIIGKSLNMQGSPGWKSFRNWILPFLRANIISITALQELFPEPIWAATKKGLSSIKDLPSASQASLYSEPYLKEDELNGELWNILDRQSILDSLENYYLSGAKGQIDGEPNDDGSYNIIYTPNVSNKSDSERLIGFIEKLVGETTPSERRTKSVFPNEIEPSRATQLGNQLYNISKDTLHPTKGDPKLKGEKPFKSKIKFNMAWDTVRSLVDKIKQKGVRVQVGKWDSRKDWKNNLVGILNKLSVILTRYASDPEVANETILEDLMALVEYVNAIGTAEELEEYRPIINIIDDLYKASAPDSRLEGSTSARISKSFKQVKGLLKWKEYEDSFWKKTIYFEKASEGDRSKIGISDAMISGATASVVANVDNLPDILSELYASLSPERVIKHDIRCIRAIGDVIAEGDLIEVKNINPNKDHYLSEFLAIYKNPLSPEYETPDYKEAYNQIIDGLYRLIEINGDHGIIDRIKSQLHGVFYKDYIYVPINDIELYWSNKGWGSCSDHRLAVRFRVTNTANIKNITFNPLQSSPPDNQEAIVRTQTGISSPDQTVCDEWQVVHESINTYIEEALGF